MKKFFIITSVICVCEFAQSAFLELLVQETKTVFRILPRRSYHVITPGIKPILPPLPVGFLEQQQEKPLPFRKVHFLDRDHTRFVVDKEPISSIKPPEIKEQNNHSIRVNLDGVDLKKK